MSNRNDMPPQMPPFSQRGQGTAEANQKQHAQRLANTTEANHGAVVYTWSGDDKPTVHNFQSEFRGLHPQLALYLLASPALSPPSWHLGWCYGVELHAGDLIFLKANHVADTLEFDKPLHSRTLYPIYLTHLPHNFPGGRGYRMSA